MDFRLILKSELLKNTSILVTGTVLAQTIPLLMQLILRRLYPVEAFGTYSAYLSLVGMVAVISTLRYDDAIVLPGKDKDSANLLAVSQIFNFAICIILFLTILLFGRQILEFINLSSKISVSVLYIIPAGAFLINIYQAFNYWLIRKKMYRNVSVNKMVRRGTEAVTQVSSSFFKVPSGLILSDIAGQVANVGATVTQGFRNGFGFALVSRNKMRYVLKKYSEFPKFNLIPAFMSTYSFALPPLIINKFYSAGNAGFFDLSKNVLSIPLAFIAVSVSNVLLQKIAELFNKKQSFIGELRPVFYIVLFIIIAEILVISFFGPVLFSFVFGREYYFSGEISRIMVWSFVLNFFISSFSCLFYSMRKIKIYSIWQAIYFIAIISLVFFEKLDFLSFLKIYVGIEVICYLCLIFIMASVVMKYERSIRASDAA